MLVGRFKVAYWDIGSGNWSGILGAVKVTDCITNSLED